MIKKGDKFSRLTTLYKIHNHKKKNQYWLCICECGNLKEVSTCNLKSGNTKSCGCLNKEVVSKRFTKHHKSSDRMYHIYKGIKTRCYNNHNPAYPNYGGRGIAVCDEWKNDFMAFYDWSMSHGYDYDLTIDRIDNNKGYSPDNCRWVDRKTQNRNKRNNRNYTINGETHCLMEWCEILGIKYRTVQDRICRGLTIKEALKSKV